MMTTLQSYVRRSQRSVLGFLRDPGVQTYARGAAYVLAGFCMSAASIANGALPLSVALVCACSGWSAVLCAAGGAVGYLLFWGKAGYQGLVWLLGGLSAVLIFGDRRARRETPLMIPALAGLVVSAVGVLFQTCLQDTTPVGLYVLRVCLAITGTLLFTQVLRGRNPFLDWIAWGFAVLALAQIVPLPYVSLGFVAGGALTVMGAFPAAALAGVALDVAQVTPVSMTAVLCGSYLVRFLPKYPKWMLVLAPTAGYLSLMSLKGVLDPSPIPGLLLGGILGTVLPVAAKVPARRGETGVAQVRLEMAAGALLQTQQMLLEAPEVPVDEDALVARAAEAACSGCPCRKNCKDSRKLAQLPTAILHKSLVSVEELPIVCRKSGRYLAQLHRFQEQLRSIRADRERQQEYRAAVVQQYRFLAQYLQDLSDRLAQKSDTATALYTPKVEIFGNRPQADNGDRVLAFAGVGTSYYVILCDGMGTGMGAVQEARIAQNLLHRLLAAGYPAAHALQSLNSICALRSRAGAVTVDLLELQLDTGKARLYKWGAVPSYLISKPGTEKIGTAGPPPGLSVEERRDTAYGLSLRRGETLVLVSDGVGEEEALHCCLNMEGSSPGELARSLLTCSQYSGEDDATVVLVHLDPGYASA